MIRSWQQSIAHRKRGRKVNSEFEAAVLGELIYVQMQHVDNVERAVIVANVAHSYAVIEQAARVVQKTQAFNEDA